MMTGGAILSDDVERDEAEDRMAAGGPITAEEYLERSVPVEPGGTLFVDLERGRVSVASHQANEVRIEAVGRGWASERCIFTLEVEGSDVYLDGDVEGWLGIPWLSSARVEVRAWVPRRYSVEVITRGGRIQIDEIGGRVGVQTGGGEIDVRRVIGPVDLRTSGGAILVEKVDSDVYAKTSGGRIEISDVNGEIEAKTSGGRIEINDASGVVRAKTSGGSVFASFVDDPAGELETSGGSIEVLFPRDGCVDLNAKTSGGQVRVDHEMRFHQKPRKNHKVGEINGGGADLRLRTSGGAIKVRAD